MLPSQSRAIIMVRNSSKPTPTFAVEEASVLIHGDRTSLFVVEVVLMRAGFPRTGFIRQLCCMESTVRRGTPA